MTVIWREILLLGCTNNRLNEISRVGDEVHLLFCGQESRAQQKQPTVTMASDPRAREARGSGPRPTSMTTTTMPAAAGYGCLPACLYQHLWVLVGVALPSHRAAAALPATQFGCWDRRVSTLLLPPVDHRTPPIKWVPLP